MLLCLSAYKDISNSKEEVYMYQGKAYRGIQTNEAPTKCLLDLAKQDGSDICTIFCITSQLVYTQKVKDDKTQFELYRELVNEQTEKQIDVKPIFYDFKDEEEEQIVDANQRAIYVYTQLAKEMQCLSGVNVYVDYTGGFRDVSYLMTTIIRYLEFNNIHCRRIIYSDFYKTPKTIIDIHYIYEMFQMINGVSEFVNTGSSRQLSQVFRKLEENSVNDVIRSMRHFSDVISLCNIGEMDAAINDVANSLRKFEEESPNDFFAELFKSLIPLIKEKMYVDKEGKITYPQLIKWCVDNWLLQQAITLYVEKMPLYYLNEKKEIFQNIDIDEFEVKPQVGSTIEGTKFYTNLYDYFLEGEEVWAFRKSVLKMLKESTENEKPDMDKFMQKLKFNCKKSDALERLFNFMNHCENEDIYGSKIEMKDMKETKKWKFLQSLCDNSKEKYRHYFVYDDETVYTGLEYHLSKEEKDNKETNTYRRKKYAVERVKDERLRKVMQHYLAMKLLRNRMNHASEKDMTADEKVGVDYLKRVGIEINTNVENICKIILQGLELTE